MHNTHHAGQTEELGEIGYCRISYLQNQVLKLQQSVRHRNKHMAEVRLVVNAFITSTSVSTATYTLVHWLQIPSAIH